MECGSKIKVIRWRKYTGMEYLGRLFDCRNSISLWNKRVIYHRLLMSTGLNVIHSYFIHAAHLISALAQGLNLSCPTF